MTIRAALPAARAGPGTIEVTDKRVFGLDNEALTQRLALRGLQFVAVLSYSPAMR